MAKSADGTAVLASMYFGPSADLLASSVYSCVEPAVVYVMFRDDPNSLRIHVEGRASKGHLGELVNRSERIAERLIASARKCGYRLDSVTISLYANDDLITLGKRHTFGRRLLSRFSDTIFGDVVIGFLTFLLAGVLTQKWRESAVVGAASILCLVAWLAIEIKRGSDAFDYAKF
jgi:hypothetical protein